MNKLSALAPIPDLTLLYDGESVAKYMMQLEREGYQPVRSEVESKDRHGRRYERIVIATNGKPLAGKIPRGVEMIHR